MKTKFSVLLLLAFFTFNICSCSSKSKTVVPNSQRYNYYKEKFVSEGYDLNEPLGSLWVSGDFCEDIIAINNIVDKYDSLSSYKLILPESNNDFTCNMLLDNYLNTIRIFYIGNDLLTPEELNLVETYHEGLVILFMWAFISF